MCGIVGYVGERDAAPIIVESLVRLEYRGYDSAGVATIHEGRLYVEKDAGKLTEGGEPTDLQRRLKSLPGKIGIGHTRWATHGDPTRENAHPHTDCRDRIAVVHNGIIENFSELRRELEERGHRFTSETDTEVVPHLIEEFMREGRSFFDAFVEAVKRLEGSYAIAAICVDEPDVILAARKESPLVVGLGDDGNFLASDIPAILPETNEVIPVDDGEVVVVKRDEVKILDAETLEDVTDKKEVQVVEEDPHKLERHGYPHFMLKEIHEQPEAVRNTLTIERDRLVEMAEELARGEYRRLYIVACGTSYHAGLGAKYAMEMLARFPVDVVIASEFRYVTRELVDEETLVLAISQSGETADTLAAVREANERGATTIALTNVVGSTITREVDHVMYTHAGFEKAVAATKTYTAQLAAMYTLTVELARRLGELTDKEAEEYHEELGRVPEMLERVLEWEREREIAVLGGRYKERPNWFFIGRGPGYPTAMEGALKLKEITYQHAEAYPAGELKHGPLALIEEGVPVVAVAQRGGVYEKMLANIEEVKARGATVITVAEEGDENVEEHSDHVIRVPKISEVFSPIVYTVPLQLLAYYMSVARGIDPDYPRNLAKSVTVE
ncbi:MAG: glutamine--fructose-6-phosphate transaminase (isomerizing) [Euryarchaeota archaeon]